MSRQDIRFVIEGTEMEDGFNLYHIIKSMSEFHNILDKAYLALSNRGKIAENDRKFYQVKMISTEKGSFIADLSIAFMAAYQLTLPFANTLTPKEIWEITLQGYKYLKFVLDAFKRGETVRIEAGEGNMVNIINGDNNTLNIYKITLNFIGQAYNDFQDLVSNIGEGKGIEKITIADIKKEDRESINIDKGDKELFQRTKSIDEVPVKLKGQIYRIDGHSFTGRLAVLDSNDQDVAIGKEYAYDLINQDDINTCTAAFMNVSEITALKEISFNPSTLKNSVTRLKVINIKNGTKD